MRPAVVCGLVTHAYYSALPVDVDLNIWSITICTKATRIDVIYLVF